MPNKKYKVLDLFAGVGGFSLGFKLFTKNGISPFDVIGYLEIDSKAANTIITNLINSGMTENEALKRVICNDITENSTKIKLYKQCPSVDIIIGGPPCQSFSTIGPRSGCKEKQARFANDQRDNLFQHYIDIVNHYKPKYFIFENVTGILSKKNYENKKYIDIIVETFERIGYNLTIDSPEEKKYLVLNAADYGVPQLRERVILIGNRIGKKNPIPQKTHCPPELESETGLFPFITLRDAIGDLPKIVSKITYTPSEKGVVSLNKIPTEQKERIKSLNEFRDNGSDPVKFNWVRFNEAYESGSIARKNFLDFIKPKNSNVMMSGHIARGQQETDILLFSEMEPGCSSKDLLRRNDQNSKDLLALIKYNMDSFTDKYKKLSWDKPCSTIFAHMQKDGNRFIHPDSDQERTLTVREAARIQSFPDEFIFEAPGLVRHKYIGNAVPPLLARAIARALYEVLKGN